MTPTPSCEPGMFTPPPAPGDQLPLPGCWVEAATTPEAISRLLAKHGLGARAPPAPCAPLGQLRFAFMR
ncbi:MAG: hypothetical protein ABI895_42980 [Deltaproteobacteria bacterium]